MAQGERDLQRLLASLEPRLAQQRYAFEITDRPELNQSLFALVREDEGITAIRASPTGDWALISLAVHSSLEAVGLTAAVSGALADAGICANIVAALHHDHLFVPWERRDEALAALHALSKVG